MVHSGSHTPSSHRLATGSHTPARQRTAGGQAEAAGGKAGPAGGKAGPAGGQAEAGGGKAEAGGGKAAAAAGGQAAAGQATPARGQPSRQAAPRRRRERSESRGLTRRKPSTADRCRSRRRRSEMWPKPGNRRWEEGGTGEREERKERREKESVLFMYKERHAKNGHQHAIAYAEGEKYYGAKATINVWQPKVQEFNEFSLSQLWILGGSFGEDLNSIEVGWQVSPDLYGDNYTRLFTYWTDPKEGHWWMQFGRDYVLGYWPSFLFSYLADSASMIQWGGEAVNSEPDGVHTSTEMGSGHFAEEGYSKASYFRNIQIVDGSNNLRAPTRIGSFTEQSNCYNVQNGNNGEWGQYFYYGGPGRSSTCP
ncbi:hypothetical protein ZIOFF_019083 [Zingiber officinale]|uniref:Neprosin PEP catalytic domain-containing protein n=1 Tax=Zingiber officinale TaxID=94328 RepID=A0A8J5H718_ZINOF|nr:hypothetical protein ZIOFF_019083 [Zingiber officinale]